MKVLFILESCPFPPKDGVTVSISSVCAFFISFSSVTLAIKEKKNIYNLYNIKNVDKDLEFFDRLHLNVIMKREFDYIITYGIYHSIKLFWFNFKGINKIITILNDCYVYVLLRKISVARRIGVINISNVFDIVKIIPFYILEFFVALFSHKIFFQTKRDLKVFSMLFFFFEKKLVEFSNNYHFSRRDHSLRRVNSDSLIVGFVATFEGTYFQMACWFIEKVWITVLNNKPCSKLCLLGKGNKDIAKRMIEKYPILINSIIVEDYIEDISSFYKKCNLTVAPIFKGYGLINKVIESMNYGCCVLGDETAFNGIDNIECGKNALIASNDIEFINFLLKDDIDFEKIGIEAMNAIDIFNRNTELKHYKIKTELISENFN